MTLPDALIASSPMLLRKFLTSCAAATFCCVTVASAALVWRPGEGWTDEKGGDISASSSRDTLDLARKLEKDGDYENAMKAYKTIIRRWPLSFSSPEAQFKIGWCQEKKGDFWAAYKSYQRMLEKYPASAFFDQAIEREFAIGNLYLSGEPQRLWKIPVGPSMDKTVEIFEAVIKNAPYGSYAPQAQFKIGLAREKQKKYDEAIKAYNVILDKYPGNDIADDAQYQIGYAWMRASSEPDYDQSAAQKAIEAFQDFLTRYPNSEKAAQAQDNINALHSRQTQGSFNIAQFYETQHDLKAAYIYYNDVIKENPDSPQAQIAKKKVQDLRPFVAKDLNLPPVASNNAAPDKSTSTNSANP